MKKAMEIESGSLLPKGILLDLDDTILAFDQVADTSWIKVLNRYSYEIPNVDVNDLFRSIKQRATRYWSDPKRHRVGRMNLRKARQEIVFAALTEQSVENGFSLASRIAQEYSTERDLAIEIFPGAYDTIVQLRNLGVKLALLTNGAADSQRTKIERFHLAPLFDCVLIEGEFGIGKPDERIYREALCKLGMQAEETWMIGDNLEWEVAAPQRLGIKGIWVDNKGNGLPDDCQVQPYRIIRSLQDLILKA